MSANKTIPTLVPVSSFLGSLEDKGKEADSRVLVEMMQKVTGEEPRMWGPSIVGFGKYHYIYESGREGDMMLCGFSPRKRNFSLYVGAGAAYSREYLDKLGKFTMGKSCLYIRKLSDIDPEVLKQLIANHCKRLKHKYNQ